MAKIGYAMIFSESKIYLNISAKNPYWNRHSTCIILAIKFKYLRVIFQHVSTYLNVRMWEENRMKMIAFYMPSLHSEWGCAWIFDTWGDFQLTEGIKNPLLLLLMLGRALLDLYLQSGKASKLVLDVVTSKTRESHFSDCPRLLFLRV